ncbi:hypothetical protein B4900_11015 [Yersinia rohdei]|nr:hypothetical protein B4900_11015 [Yersinia rohdei]
MNNPVDLLIANAELAAGLLQHMADNEIDSDYFAVVTDSPNCGREVQSEHSVTEAALMAAGIIEQLIAQLEAAQKSSAFLKEQMAQLANFNPDWDKLEACQDSWRELSALQKETLHRAEAAEAALSAANEKLSKPVVLPAGYSVRAGHPINEGERHVLIPKEGGRWLSRFDVEHAIRVAGFTVEGNADAE